MLGVSGSLVLLWFSLTRLAATQRIRQTKYRARACERQLTTDSGRCIQELVDELGFEARVALD